MPDSNPGLARILLASGVHDEGSTGVAVAVGAGEVAVGTDDVAVGTDDVAVGVGCGGMLPEQVVFS